MITQKFIHMFSHFQETSLYLEVGTSKQKTSTSFLKIMKNAISEKTDENIIDFIPLSYQQSIKSLYKL